MKAWHWQDCVNTALGIWIIVSPFVLQHTMATAASPGGVSGDVMWNLYIIGGAVTVLAAAALVTFRAWEEWMNLALGAWLLVLPWLLGFGGASALMWNAVISGVVIAVLAGWALNAEQLSKQTR